MLQILDIDVKNIKLEPTSKLRYPEYDGKTF